MKARTGLYVFMENTGFSAEDSGDRVLLRGQPSGMFNYRGRTNTDSRPVAFKRLMEKKGLRVVYTANYPVNVKWKRNIPLELIEEHSINIGRFE